MTRPNRVAPHDHYCPICEGWYGCGKVSFRCLLPLKTVAECPICPLVQRSEERRRVVRSRRFWAMGSNG